MRDILYIFGLFAFFLLLAADFPEGMAERCAASEPRAAFASFVELPPAMHAACLESARTTWQVRNGSRGRPVIGILDSGIPLLTDHLPPRENVVFKDIEIQSKPVGPTDISVYSLMPATEGVNSPAFETRSISDSAVVKEVGASAKAPFPDDEMLSTDRYRKLKEIMQ